MAQSAAQLEKRMRQAGKQFALAVRPSPDATRRRLADQEDP
jgi:hypothetical protein